MTTRRAAAIRPRAKAAPGRAARVSTSARAPSAGTPHELTGDTIWRRLAGRAPGAFEAPWGAAAVPLRARLAAELAKAGEKCAALDELCAGGAGGAALLRALKPAGGVFSVSAEIWGLAQACGPPLPGLPLVYAPPLYDED